MEFKGAAIPLAQGDIEAVAAGLGVHPAVLYAVKDIESGGKAFLPDGRPDILYEAHVFGRRTGHRYDDSHPNISAPSWDRSLYGKAGAHQYDRLHEAIALNRKAALESCSWGGMQVMGFNAEMTPWPDIEDFVAAMCESEKNHLLAFVGEITHSGALNAIQRNPPDFATFARIYNGAGYAANQYDTKLESAYRRHLAAATGVSAPISAVTPIETIKRIQEALGVVNDGAFGRRSRAAMNAVLTAAGQPGI